MDALISAIVAAVGRRPAAAAGFGLTPMLEALEAKAGYSTDHVIAVRSLALSIARQLGLGRSERGALARGALLHDIGKLAVPDEILAKPGPLDIDEWHIMRGHPAAGASLLRPLVDDLRVLAIVRSHHERWDGAGYPDGLAGEDIPLGARIVAVADAFQAMLEARPYRPAVPVAAALAYVAAEAEGQFDPACVSALTAVAAAAYRAPARSPLPQPA